MLCPPPRDLSRQAAAATLRVVAAAHEKARARAGQYVNCRGFVKPAGKPGAGRSPWAVVLLP